MGRPGGPTCLRMWHNTRPRKQLAFECVPCWHCEAYLVRITVLRERNASGENMRRGADLEGGATATSVKTAWRSFLMRTSNPVSQRCFLPCHGVWR